jgi:hypothetical protein
MRHESLSRELLACMMTLPRDLQAKYLERAVQPSRLMIASSVFVLLSFPSLTFAADGAVCYSALHSYIDRTPIDYPQLSNDMLFNCKSPIPASTVSGLSAAGWIIIAIDEVDYSRTSNGSGVVTVQTRTRLIIQK